MLNDGSEDMQTVKDRPVVAADERDERRQAFASALVAARDARDMNQSALADLLGVTQSNVSQWERSRHTPEPETVFAIERALDLPPGHLSHLLGFVPVGTFYDSEPCTFERAVTEDPFLSDLERDVLMRAYSGVVGRHRSR